MLAVIQDEQQFSGFYPIEQLMEHGLIGRQMQTERLRSNLGNEGRLTYESQIDQPGAIVELFFHRAGNLNRQAGLATSSTTGKGNKTSGGKQVFYLCQFSPAPDETCPLYRQI